MTAKENFSQLTDKVNEAQANVQAAMSKDRADLQAQVEQAQSSAEQKAGEIKAQRRGERTKPPPAGPCPSNQRGG